MRTCVRQYTHTHRFLTDCLARTSSQHNDYRYRLLRIGSVEGDDVLLWTFLDLLVETVSASAKTEEGKRLKY